MTEPTWPDALVERVARAIYASDLHGFTWDHNTAREIVWDAYRVNARAALAAMPRPIRWMTARLWDDGDWTIHAMTYPTESAARADAGSGIVVALVPIEVQP